MNVNHHQTKRERSYFEWGDKMQIIRKGKGDIAMTESELVDFYRCNMEETQLSSAATTKSIFPTSRWKGYRGVGSIRKWAVKRLCPTLSAFNHHRFILSIGQHGSTLVQEIHLSRTATPCTCEGADIPKLQWQYQLIHFSFSSISIYDITTKDIKLW